MKAYVISDLHFGHCGIIKLERREFENIEEHDNFVIQTINKTVKNTDILWILGDIGNPEKLRYLNGHKYLILGNHDKRSIKEYSSYVKEVYKFPQFISERVVFSHHPIPVDSGMLNVHGHLHGSYLNSRNHFNVSAAMINYEPIRIDKMYHMAGSLGETNNKFLEEWYADKYIFTDRRDCSDIVCGDGGLIDLELTKQLRRNLLSKLGDHQHEEKSIHLKRPIQNS